jgi:quinoprotein glucose dehydrogenase
MQHHHGTHPAKRTAAALLLGAIGACNVLASDGIRDPALAGMHADWRVALGDPGSSQYSALEQIDRGNVHRLQPAWVYRTGDHREDGRSQIQANPIIVDGVLYSTTPGLNVFALRADTGEEIWRFDPFTEHPRYDHVNRGVVYWEAGDERRILFTAGPRLYALDAGTGAPIRSFGENGSVDLKAGLGRDVGTEDVVATSPGVIHRDLLIQGTRVSEAEGAAPGHIRAFDVRTGGIRWTFFTIPRPGEFGAETWPAGAWDSAGGANSWPGLSVDVARGIVFVPTGSPTPDFYGGGRIGENLFGNSLLALDAATGQRIWHYQMVRHDLWDRDLPAAPNLVTVRRGLRRIDAVAQVTKSGHVFVFERTTGRPLFPIEERPVPPSDLRGEQAWPTQPIPLSPPPFARQHFTEAEVTDRSPEARAHVLERFRGYRAGGQFVPPSVQGTIIFPGLDGGAEWGGAAFDRRRGILYVNSNEMPWILQKLPIDEADAAEQMTAAELYQRQCAVCHGAEHQGDGGRTPALTGVAQRLAEAEIRQVVAQGRGFMPPFSHLSDAERDAVVDYLLGRESDAFHASASAARPGSGNPYRFAGYHRFLDPDGYPAVRPPWGTLNAIDLNRGRILWSVPLGEYPELTARGVPRTGTENYGGPVVTGGGLIFIGATRDERFRAFDKETGRLLWETQLPAGGYATPSTYSVGGKQYVVIAAGGGKMGTKSGDSYLAFALPD